MNATESSIIVFLLPLIHSFVIGQARAFQLDETSEKLLHLGENRLSWCYKARWLCKKAGYSEASNNYLLGDMS